MTFHSILFARPDDRANPVEDLEFLLDLNLDQVIGAVTVGRDEYGLVPLFHAPLRRVEAIEYRHEVFRDLWGRPLLGRVEAFAAAMREVRGHLTRAGKLRHRRQKESWFLAAVRIYCDAVAALSHDLERADLRSRGLAGFRAYLAGYVASDGFAVLSGQARALREQLRSVEYCLRIKGSRVTVSAYDGQEDYSAQVLATFERFKQGAVKDYRVAYRDWVEMNHVEEQVLDLVARLFPDVFRALDEYCARHRGFLDATLAAFDREVQFYAGYLEHVEPLERTGLEFCYPQVSGRSKRIHARETFDLALAGKLLAERTAAVRNDFHLDGPERIVVVTGPNQGGKTTFARTFGQLHYLAALGCPVPGRDARLLLCDRVFTHFEKGEAAESLRGKLQDDLVRIHQILDQATEHSIIVMNEIFTSTTLNDAVYLGQKVMERIMALDALCVYVTFIDELASLGEATVSMVAAVRPEDPAGRTYKLERKSADGLSYATALAERNGLTYQQLRGRIES